MSDENKTEEKDTKKLPVKKRYFFTFLAIVAVIVGGYFLYDTLGSESTDDAYVETTKTTAHIEHSKTRFLILLDCLLFLLAIFILLIFDYW